MTQDQRSVAIFSLAAVLLSIPFIAMQFTKEVDWTGSDFVIGAVLLFGTAGVTDVVLRRVQSIKNRVILTVLVLGMLFLVWAEFAVGLFGTPFAGS